MLCKRERVGGSLSCSKTKHWLSVSSFVSPSIWAPTCVPNDESLDRNKHSEWQLLRKKWKLQAMDSPKTGTIWEKAFWEKWMPRSTDRSADHRIEGGDFVTILLRQYCAPRLVKKILPLFEKTADADTKVIAITRFNDSFTKLDNYPRRRTFLIHTAFVR